uniref:Protein kinase domain-containing protein n=1 Tax=Oryza meridionalis TaxID=40149 RepID=A0A0E0FDT7_9ORYZ
MHLAGGRLLLLLLCVGVQLLLILPDGALSASPAAAGGDERCRRQCGGLAVPYPFGFSGDCPILLACDEGNSTAALLRPTNGTSSSSYTVAASSFNSTASTLLVSLPPSCNRTVSDARRWLSGANYGVSSRTGLFLRGCQNATSTNCNVPAEVILRTEKCGGNASTVTCIAAFSAEPDIAKGVGLFARWDMVDEPRCDNLLTSVYGETKEQLFSLEFAVAELGWWVNGSCSGAAAGDLAGRCAANATCHDVQTPSGAWGHRCECHAGLIGDGFAAGEGCRFPAKKSSTKKILIIVGGVLAGTVAAGVLVLCCARCRRSGGGGRRSGFDRLAAKRLLSEAASSSGVPVYSYHEVARATNSFSHTHRLGTGAYGTVYVGKLPASSPSLVAIKRMRRRHDDGDGDAAVAVLLNEVKLISSLSHPGLVRLLGCCLDRGEQILVYEFVPNGTLAHHLAGGGLPWRARLGVAAETAAAIAYLHAKRPPILHRDVKSSNILLDGDLRPRLADFGLSRAVGRLDQASLSHVSTAPQGTPGYLDPEYHQNFHLSDKSDVYSFGVVLLELITAMKVVDFARPAAEVNLASLALDRIGKGRVDDIVDPALVDRGDEWVMRSVRHVSELAFRCLAFQKDVRPAMSEVAAELARIRDAAPASVPGARTGVGSRPPMVIDVGVGFDGVDAAVKKAGSPVSVQDVWISDQSSPSTNGSMPRFA